jgi:iron complex transport system substrate-binding protein
LRGCAAILLVFLIMACAPRRVCCEDHYPRRIVSLGPTITEKLFLLGVEDRIIAVTTYCQRPPRAQDKKKVGNVTHINIEEVFRLHPDLVVGTALTDRRAVEQLKRLGLKTVVFNDPKSFVEMKSQFLELGRILGRDKEAAKIVGQSEKRITIIRERVSNLNKPSVFVQVGTRPLFAATGTSFINDFVLFAGGTNIAADAKSGFYNREEVLRKNPDVIIIVTMGIAAEEEKRIWLRFVGLRAARTGRIYLMDPYKVCSPTPVTFVEALEDFATAIHPDVPW